MWDSDNVTRKGRYVRKHGVVEKSIGTFQFKWLDKISITRKKGRKDLGELKNKNKNKTK